ncbi:LuxR C-terminal-related transcriptional regulator [Enterobacillus tribolii]|uniref:DNA-binding NarL/FixJ family response regulator n=1 Tax=Enterobacillus tribolii TaxID=1487935 RepID=A0A370R1W1_9GAMM|nr:LuxR C-terminal-related transcriptional regulator [Enterobacillus tribolii]MBW7982986.1 response regulator transcription factor [Enterobacillus tribolii]RDK95911.1 DNA-binding NarL/FixJ family response regulator [Enterobacillus tribolii]
MALITPKNNPGYTQLGDHRILVLEPNYISWLGIYSLIKEVDGKEENICRLFKVKMLYDISCSFLPDVILLPSVDGNMNLLALIQQLSSLASHSSPPRIVACLKDNIPYLDNLLYSLGVQTVVTSLCSPEELINSLTKEAGEQTVLFTPQERNILQEMLAGRSIDRTAKMMGKSIYAISSQKQAVMQKLKMRNPIELQLLGGRLIASGIK